MESEKGQKNALGVFSIIMVAVLVLILAGVGMIAGVPAIILGPVVGLIVTAVMLFGKFY